MLLVKRYSVSSPIISWLWTFLFSFPPTIPPQPCCSHSAQATREFLTLLSLPSEIFMEIATYLDCTSIFALRLCSKSLYSLTKSHHMWRQVTRRLYEDYLLAPPEGGIHRYSAEELERWSLRRSLVQDVWKTRRRPHPRARIVDLCEPDRTEQLTMFHHLLPGGRWLLVAHPSSLTCIFDLDSVTPKPQVLFDLNQIDETISTNRELLMYSVWDDRSNSQRIRIATTVRNYEVPRTFVHELHFDLLPVRSGSVTAIPIIAFRKPKLAWVSQRTAINEHYFVEICVHPRRRPYTKEIVVYCYTDYHGCSQYPLLEPVAQLPFEQISVAFVYFVHDNVFTVHTGQGGLSIFDIVRHDTESHAPTHSIILLHQIPSFSFHFSGPMQWSPGTSHMVTVSLAGEFQGLRIPHDRRKPPSVVPLGKHETFMKQNVGKALGISTSLCVNDSEEPICILNHEFDYDDPLSVSFKASSAPLQIPHLTFASILIDFNADIGRLVLFKDRRRNDLLVVDLIEYPYSPN